MCLKIASFFTFALKMTRASEGEMLAAPSSYVAVVCMNVHVGMAVDMMCHKAVFHTEDVFR